MKICSIEGCTGIYKCRGLCRTHYSRWQIHGDPNINLRKMKEFCEIEGCNNKSVSRNLCDKHYSRWRTHGNPYVTKCKFNVVEYKSREELFLAKLDIKIENDCWDWMGPKNKSGYGRLNYAGITIPSHRFSYMYFIGYIPEGILVCHHCDRPSCCNPFHLFLGTVADNNKDKSDKGRNNTLKGSECPWSKLNEEKVRLIKKRLNNGEIGRHLAKEFNVHVMTISNIKNNKIWQHALGDHHVKT